MVVGTLVVHMVITDGDGWHTAAAATTTPIYLKSVFCILFSLASQTANYAE